MDISHITDAKELKALAYDQFLLMNTARENLRLIQQRLQKLTAVPPPKPDTEPKKD